MTIADCWQELVTVALLGTDRRDPPELPPGALADIVDDVVASTPSERMLAAVGACTALRRAGLRPHPPAARLVPPEPDQRPMLPPAAARRWRTIVSEWSVLEDEWLDTVERRGWRLSPDVLVGLLRRHRTDNARRSRAMRIGGSVATWLVEQQPDLAAPASHRRPPEAVDSELPALAVAPTLFPMLVAAPDAVIGALAGGLLDGTFGLAHRAVLVNFVARVRPDALGPLADALAALDPSARPSGSVAVGLARALADLASTRRLMLEELDR